MALTEKQLKLVLHRLGEMNFKALCPVCGENNWEPDGIAATPTLNEKMEVQITNTIPTVIMCCNRCGYILQLSAVKLGLLP